MPLVLLGERRILTFEVLKDEQKNSLVELTKLFHRSLAGEAREHLASRGLVVDGETCPSQTYQLGLVPPDVPGYEHYEGCLSIPYIRYPVSYGTTPTVVDIRFRSLSEDGPKYLTRPGASVKLFNTKAFDQTSDFIGLAEGEFDAITASVCGLPTVGVPGAGVWQDHWSVLFQGYRKVLVFGDGDQAGRDFSERVAKLLPNAEVRYVPDGEDINSLYVKYGEEGVQTLWK